MNVSQRFSREGRLLDVQVAGRQEPAIGRHEVAGGEADHVSGNHFASSDFLPGAVAEHGRGDGDTLAEPNHGLARPVGLEEVDAGAGENDRDNDAGTDRIPDPGGNGRRCKQHDRKRIGEERE